MTRSRSPTVGVVRLSHAHGLPLPAYQSDEAAGLDLVAAVEQDAPMTLAPGQRALVPTGLVLELAKGTEAQVRPRSGLALKHGVTVLNSPGTIDSDYRGEVKVLLINLGADTFVIRRGERIAQLVVASVVHVKLRENVVATRTSRGAGGFGSTGTQAKQATGRAMSKSPGKPRKKAPDGATRTGTPAKPAKRKAAPRRRPTTRT